MPCQPQRCFCFRRSRQQLLGDMFTYLSRHGNSQVGNQVFEQARRLLDAEGREDDAVAIQVCVCLSCLCLCGARFWHLRGRRVPPSGRRQSPPVVFDCSVRMITLSDSQKRVGTRRGGGVRCNGYQCTSGGGGALFTAPRGVFRVRARARRAHVLLVEACACCPA